jgi:two-component system, cell cycle response regulator DivK
MPNASVSTAQSHLRILLVEDNETSRQLMSDYLEYQGCQVFGVAKGELFDAAVERFKPHLIILDLKLPDMDGYALLQQLQERSEWLKIPVIVVSAFAFLADQQKALRLGAKQYLVKPVSLTQLRQVICDEISRTEASVLLERLRLFPEQWGMAG